MYVDLRHSSSNPILVIFSWWVPWRSHFSYHEVISYRAALATSINRTSAHDVDCRVWAHACDCHVLDVIHVGSSLTIHYVWVRASDVFRSDVWMAFSFSNDVAEWIWGKAYGWSFLEFERLTQWVRSSSKFLLLLFINAAICLRKFKTRSSCKISFAR